MGKLKTATGKTFDCDYFNPFPATKQANIQILNTDLVTAATVFSNPVETVQLWFGEVYAAQYTKLVALVPVGNAIRIILEKE